MEQMNSNQMLSHIHLDLKIVGAFINCFRIRIESDKSCGIYIAEIMKKKMMSSNHLEKLLINKRIDQSKNSQSIEKTDLKEINFPFLSLDDLLREITLGSYQIEQSFRYLAEHKKENNDQVSIFITNANLLIPGYNKSRIVRLKLQSRHRNSTQYWAYVQFLPSETSHTAIIGWFCTCYTGRRTVGNCLNI